MNERRVVVTGMGMISCVGNNVNDSWDSIVNGKCGLQVVDRFDIESYKTQIGGQINDFDAEDYMDPKEYKRLDKFCQYAIAASDQAFSESGLPKDLRGDSSIDETRVGALVSSGIGGIKTLENQCDLLTKRGPRRTSPLLIPMMIGDMASGSISMRYGAEGPNMGIVTACATACHSIGESSWMIKRGDADIMITGGAEAAIVPIAYAGFCSMKAMSKRNDDPMRASRPFDRDRDGFVMSEGAGVLILEEFEHAKARGAEILAEIVGYGATGDAYHITSPAPGGTGAARAVKMALGHAEINSDDVDYINAHGTSTPLNDKFETEAIKSVFGEEPNASVSSTKGVTGHGLGAAGGFETISCVKSISNGVIPPTINYENPDPECDLDYTANEARERDVNVALNINLGFGGHNAVLAVKKFE